MSNSNNNFENQNNYADGQHPEEQILINWNLDKQFISSDQPTEPVNHVASYHLYAQDSAYQHQQMQQPELPLASHAPIHHVQAEFTVSDLTHQSPQHFPQHVQRVGGYHGMNQIHQEINSFPQFNQNLASCASFSDVDTASHFNGRSKSPKELNNAKSEFRAKKQTSLSHFLVPVAPTLHMQQQQLSPIFGTANGKLHNFSEFF